MKLRATFPSVRFGSLLVGVQSKLFKSVNHLLGTGTKRANAPNCDDEGFVLVNDSDSSDSGSSDDEIAGTCLRRAQNKNQVVQEYCPEARHVCTRYHEKGKFYAEAGPIANWIYQKFLEFSQLRDPTNEKERSDREVVATYDVIKLINDLGILDAASNSFIQVSLCF